MKIVIKFAGALLEDDADDALTRAPGRRTRAATATRFSSSMAAAGSSPPLSSAWASKASLSPACASPIRETRDAAVMVFAGLLNKHLAAAISAEGQPAIGVSAADAQCFRAEPMVHNEVAGSLGFVGYLTGMNIAFIESLWREGLRSRRSMPRPRPRQSSSTTSMPITWLPLAPNFSVPTS